MLNKLNIFEIYKDGINAIKGDSKYIYFIFIYYIFPIMCGFCLSYYKYIIAKNISSDIIGGIGLFAGLMFTLLFIVTNNYKTRKSQILSKEEEDIKYLERYLNFTRTLVSLISYSIIKAGLIIILTITYVSLHTKGNNISIDIQIINGLIIIQLLQFLIIIVIILKEMYAMLYDDINK